VSGVTQIVKVARFYLRYQLGLQPNTRIIE
jgi:hypothetical protein